MDPVIAAAFVSAAGSLGVSGIAWHSATRNTAAQQDTQSEVEILKEELRRQSEAEQRAIQAEDIVARYRQPLAAAAFDCQTRLYNILDKSFLQVYAAANAPRRELVIRSTVFRFAQYFGWAEILREQIQYLKTSDVADTRRVGELMAQVSKVFTTDRLDCLGLMVWRDQQRALGELMIDRTETVPRCMGFAQFNRMYEGSFQEWWREFEHELAHGPAPMSERLQLAQLAFRELAVALDADGLQFHSNRQRRATRPLPVTLAENKLAILASLDSALERPVDSENA